LAAARGLGQGLPAEAHDAARRVEALIAGHGPALLRVANHFSLCQDDALDAYQHALEIYLRRLATVDAATEGAWMRVVVKHEAMAIRRARQGSVGHDDVDFDASLPSGGRDVEDHVAGGERVERSVEALHALKPDEAKALMLKAEGLSYEEIGRRFNWTYTKVNRSITEGRARFLKAFRRIEAGDACEPYAAALAAVAAGTASAAELLELRPHLRHCTACRAVVRELRLSRGRRVALLAPVPLLRAGLAHLRHHAISTYHRISDPTPLAAVRPGAVAAAVAGCIAVGGGATYCVRQHVDPLAALSPFSAPEHHEARAKPKPKVHVKRARAVVRTIAPPPVATATVVATATPRPTPVATATAPAPTPAPTPPPAPQDEFVPGTTATTTTHTASPPKSKPAPAPASGGGGEFGGP
jgi:RNA polymerase sigma factor (sigma-70 family)